MIDNNFCEKNGWNLSSGGKYIKAKHTRFLRSNLSEIDGAIAIATNIDDKELSSSIINKLSISKMRLLSEYGEFLCDDGSIIVRHPAIGYIEISTKVNESPRKLFAARVNSPTSNTVKIFKADAKISKNGTVSYVNKVNILDMEMSQPAFSLFLSSRGGTPSPGTIISKDGVSAELVPDVNNFRAANMIKEVHGAVVGFENLADNLHSFFSEIQEKGSKMSAKSTQEIISSAGTIGTWVEKNPSFYVSRLSEFAGKTTSDIKIEARFLAEILGE